MASISFPTSIGGINIPGLSSNPLGALFSDPYEVNILKYPRDLGATTRTHYLKFDAYDVEPAKLDSITSVHLNGDFLESIKNGDFLKSIEDVATAAEVVATATKNLTNELLGNIDFNGTNSGMVGFSEKRLTQVQSVALYIPDTVNFSYNATYGEINLAGQQSAMAQLPGIIGKAANFVTGTDIGRLFLRSQGVALNPNQQVMFEGLELRTFSFDFNFMPKSAEESGDVKKIIQAFKYYSRPKTVDKSFGLIFVPPSIWKIQFMFLNGENRWVNKIADSVITNVEVEYTPNGWSTHQDGSPVNVKLKLDFKELSLIDRDGKTGVKAGY
jgi:hypothetical protein